MRWWIVPLLLASLKMIGCSDQDKGATPAKTLCTPRKTTFCRCPVTGESGWQTCLPDGSGFEECLPCDGSNLTNSRGSGGTSPSQAECGNGEVEPGEQCDDGNLDDDDACLSNCRKAKCGDGIVQVDVEECDDANSNEEDGCTSDCTVKTPPSEKCPGEIIELTSDPAGKKVTGVFQALQPNHEGTCGGTGSEAVFSFQAPSTGEVVVSLSVLDGAKVDVVIHVREGSCDDVNKEVACTNVGGPGANELAEPFLVSPGKTYHVFADSQGSTSGGFSLRVRFRPDDACSGEGNPCEVQDPKVLGACAVGTLVCSSGGTLSCQPGSPKGEICGNDKDDDCNGIVDNGCPCPHDLCTVGVPLAPDCKNGNGAVDPCLPKLCLEDDYCCTTEWDAQCVEQVRTVCGSGACVKNNCTHPICQEGGALTIGCDGSAKCVELVCKLDNFCCTKGWDAECIEKVPQVCNLTCP
ncbi:MAG: hypothetical protein RMJ98_11000 [Myxococcales bacterium]|nr:hypothetical protein [Polyangiaceae bacterium]MDW8249814.1 hypothetical protein [Myxococcales bacterium]